MGRFLDEITPDLQDWIQKQHMFVVASAPLDSQGTVNASPKGYDCLRIIHPNRACYLEMTGSGIETQSHVQENGRLTILLMAFEGAPKIVRLLGRAHVARIDTPEFQTLYDEHYRGSGSELEGARGLRSIVVLEVEKVGISCGFGVPLYEYLGQRPTLKNHWGKKTEKQVVDYWVKKNVQSMDGLPGMRHERMGLGLSRHGGGTFTLSSLSWLLSRSDLGLVFGAFAVGVALTYGILSRK